MSWFEIENIEEIDSPSLVLYRDRLAFNIEEMLKMVSEDADRLMPHVKTNKMPRVLEMMIKMGIKSFKASTISEAEIAAGAGASKVLIAHQLVGPKVQRLGALISKFPGTNFSTLIDNSATLKKLAEEARVNDHKIAVYIDINNGMDRTGIEIGTELYKLIDELIKDKDLNFKGLHVYDGHLRQVDFEMRKLKVEQGFSEIESYFKKLKSSYTDLQLISGGTPSFTSHLSHKNRICSPGTCVFWDWGYNKKLIEQHFKFAVLLVSRVISKPKEGIVTLDMGHKSVSAENPIDNRIVFLNLDDYELLSQSEEHGVLRVGNWEEIAVGDLLYGIPYHVCPTINLYDEISVIEGAKKTGTWQISARKRKITV